MSFLCVCFLCNLNLLNSIKKEKKEKLSLAPRPARLGAHAERGKLPAPQPVGALPDVDQRRAGQQRRVPLDDRELAARDGILELLARPRARRASALERLEQGRDAFDVDELRAADPLVEVRRHHRAHAVARVELEQQASVDSGVDQMRPLDASRRGRDGGDEGGGNARALPGVGVEPRGPGLDALEGAGGLLLRWRRRRRRIRS